MFHRSILWFVSGLVVSASFFTSLTTAIAHQDAMVSDVNVTSHLEPDDAPYAGEPSLTWFHLTHTNGETVPLAACVCTLVVYDAQNQPIAYPQLGEADVEGHEQPITTTITFPSPGNYQLVLTGQPVANQFTPFEIKVPVTVRP